MMYMYDVDIGMDKDEDKQRAILHVLVVPST